MATETARNFLARTVSKTRYSARKIRSLEFDIDTDYVMKLGERQGWRCALTGWPLQFTRGGKFDGKNPRAATMDRKDNSKGYVKGNIQLTCAMPNIIRRHLSMQQFRELCRAVADHSRP